MWQQIKGEDQEDVCGAECPKSNINWLQALEFANQMSMIEGLDQCYRKGRRQKAQTVVEIEFLIVQGIVCRQMQSGCKFSSLDPDLNAVCGFRNTIVRGLGGSRKLLTLNVIRFVNCHAMAISCVISQEMFGNGVGIHLKRKLRRVRGGGFTSAPEVALRE